MTYNDRDDQDVQRANAEADNLRDDLNRFDEDEAEREVYVLQWWADLLGVGTDDPPILYGQTFVMAASSDEAADIFDELIDSDFFANAGSKVYRLEGWSVETEAAGRGPVQMVPFDVADLPGTWNFNEVHLEDYGVAADQNVEAVIR